MLAFWARSSYNLDMDISVKQNTKTKYGALPLSLFLLMCKTYTILGSENFCFLSAESLKTHNIKQN